MKKRFGLFVGTAVMVIVLVFVSVRYYDFVSTTIYEESSAHLK